MTDRINAICSLIDSCDTFADVGCDHGFCTLYALKNGLCKSAIITDISAKCLAKAQTLLADYIERGICTAVRCDGLEGVPKDTDEVLIAGMGGEEILKILSQGFIPKKFILQPMKNADTVRAFLIERGCKITVDDLFRDGKYYFIIKGERADGASPNAPYTAAELKFGRDSLKNPVFKGFAEREIEKRVSYLVSCRDEKSFEKIQGEIALLKEALK